jgi:hypothetical protein
MSTREVIGALPISIRLFTRSFANTKAEDVKRQRKAVVGARGDPLQALNSEP